MPNDQIGSFVPTTNVWDPSELYETEVTTPAFKELMVRLYQNLNKISVNLNLKDTGYYDTSAFITGQLFFPLPGVTSLSEKPQEFRQVYRKVINFGVLANTGTINIAHGITVTANTLFTRIYGVANNQAGTSYLPLPYASGVAANNIELSVNNINVSITTGSDRTAYTITYVILEWVDY